MSKLELVDFNKICRMCLTENSTLINVFYSDAAQVISEITSIRLKEGDSLPENICIPCMDKSTEFYKFKQLCEKNNVTLQSVLNFKENPEDKHIVSDGMIVLKQEDVDNQKENSKLNNNLKNQINKTEKEISIPLKSLPNRKIEIKRSYKDLVPLETYNINKTLQIATPEEVECKDFIDQIQNYEEVSQGATFEDKLEDLEVQNEVIFSQDGNEELLEVKAEESETESVKSEDATGKERCEHCNAQFDDIQTHLEVYHPSDDSHYCYVCSKESTSKYNTVRQLRAHLRYHKQLPKYQCELCGKWFRYKHQKFVHMRLHTGERPASCAICDKTFRDPRYLAIHLKSHTGERPFKCSVCQKGFGHKFSLKVHMKTHSSEREHMCNICGKTFIYGHNLKIHLRLHTGEKPYSCHLCFNSFISCSVLRAHMLTHSDQKRFECKACGKKFKRTGDLNVHMRSHTGEKPYACTLCSNRYKMSSHLTEHMKTHTGEKNYICEICSKSFYNNKSLQVHKKTHSGQKTFNCPDCDKSFVHHTSLCAHQRKHHKQPNNC